jgi:hypothetical protein
MFSGRAGKLKRKLERLLSSQCESLSLRSYRDDPLGYVRDVLKISLTEGQTRVVSALVETRKVLVSSGHSVGKTILAASLVNWFYDTREGVCLTTAPTDRQVKDLLWKEVRTLRARAGLPMDFSGPKIPRLESSPAHFAHGYTASEATKFQGHHSSGGVFIVFDEAEGVEQDFWVASKTMLDDNSFFLACYNPTSPGSAAHLAEQEAEMHGSYRRVNLSCLDHPNVRAQLDRCPLPIPGAITLSQAETMLLEDSQVLSENEPSLPTDVSLNGKRYRPGPIAEARVLGRRPTSSTSGVWSEDLWKQVVSARTEIRAEWPVALGCDVARYGDDHTIIMVRKGPVLLHVETHVKRDTSFVAQRLRELTHEHADSFNEPRLIPCMIDEGGIGGGVIDQNQGYLFVPVNAACKPRRDERYVNVRAELWFLSKEPAMKGLLDVSRLPLSYLSRLKQELLVATYKILPTNGKIQVQSKDDMKAILKRSPDLADAFNLCLYPPENA